MNTIPLNDVNRIKVIFDSIKPDSLSNVVISSLGKLPKPDFNELIVKLGCCNGNLPKMYARVAQYFFKSLEWLPSFTEFVIFGCFVALLFIMYEIYHNTKINDRVRKESRCGAQMRTTPNSVSAIDTNANGLYTVTYDKNAKTYTIQCQNESDKNTAVTNTYGIDVYDFQQSTRDNVVRKTVSQQCKQDFTAASGNLGNANSQVIYTGDEGLVNFMKKTDSDYFRL